MGILVLSLAIAGVGLGQGLGSAAERRVDLYSVLRAFGIGYVVDRFGEEINQLINALTLRTTEEAKQATKVVPIISAGSGAYVGAAQVSGSEAQVARVQAVGQLEGAFFDGAVRAKALVPVDNRNPLAGIRRVQGVGLLAVIDYNVESVVDEPGSAPAPTPQPPVNNPPTDPPDNSPPVRHHTYFNDSDYPALGYLLFAQDGIWVRGNANSLNGSIRSNEEIRISGNRNSVSGRRISDGAWLSLPRFSSREWRSRADRVYDKELSVRDFTVRGVTFVDGDLRVRGDVRGNGILVVDGKVEISGKSVRGDLIIFAADDISIRASNASIRAALISAGGTVAFTGSRVRLNGLAAGESVSIRGNNGSYVYDDQALRAN